MTRWTPGELADHLARLADRKLDNDTDAANKPDFGSESELQRKINKWARDNGFPILSLRQTRQARGLLSPGWPDITLLLPGGRVVFIELKAGKGRLSDEQKALHAQARYLGHEIHEVRSFKRFLEIVGGR